MASLVAYLISRFGPPFIQKVSVMKILIFRDDAGHLRVYDISDNYKKKTVMCGLLLDVFGDRPILEAPEPPGYDFSDLKHVPEAIKMMAESKLIKYKLATKQFLEEQEERNEMVEILKFQDADAALELIRRRHVNDLIITELADIYAFGDLMGENQPPYERCFCGPDDSVPVLRPVAA